MTVGSVMLQRLQTPNNSFQRWRTTEESLDWDFLLCFIHFQCLQLALMLSGRDWVSSENVLRKTELRGASEESICDRRVYGGDERAHLWTRWSCNTFDPFVTFGSWKTNWTWNRMISQTVRWVYLLIIFTLNLTLDQVLLSAGLVTVNRFKVSFFWNNVN